MSPTRTLAAALVAVAPFAAQAELIVNGSFEDNAIAHGQWTVMAGLNGWQADATSGVELRRNVAGTAHQGHHFVELDTHKGSFGANTFDTTTNSGIWQTVSTTAGQLYDLSWYYSPRAGVAQASNGIAVYWNNALIFTNSASGVGNSGHVWSQTALQVLGTGSDTLRFAAIGTQDSLGGSLDGVSMTTAVPEPGTTALMAAGLAAVGFLARRRRTA